MSNVGDGESAMWEMGNEQRGRWGMSNVGDGE